MNYLTPLPSPTALTTLSHKHLCPCWPHSLRVQTEALYTVHSSQSHTRSQATMGTHTMGLQVLVAGTLKGLRSLVQDS